VIGVRFVKNESTLREATMSKDRSPSRSELNHYSLEAFGALDALELAHVPSMLLRAAQKSPEFQNLMIKGAKKLDPDGLHPKYRWVKNERYVNHVLLALLLALPPKANIAWLATLGIRLPMKRPVICRGHSPKIGKYIGECDFLILDRHEKSALLGEIKVAGKPGNERYQFGQYTKYMLYGALLRVANIAEHVAHLVIVPDADPRKFCRDSKQWKPVLDGYRLTASADHIPMPYGNREGWIQHAESFLRDKKHQLANDFDNAAVDRLRLRDTAPNLISTYVVTWSQWSGALTAPCLEWAEHLCDSVQTLTALGNGTYGFPVKFNQAKFRRVVIDDLTTVADYGNDSILSVLNRAWLKAFDEPLPTGQLEQQAAQIVEDEWDKYFEDDEE